MVHLAPGTTSDEFPQLNGPTVKGEQTKQAAPVETAPAPQLVERVNRAGQALAQIIQSSESKLASAMRLPNTEKFDELFALVAAISSHLNATV